MAKSSDFGEVNFDIRGGGRSEGSSAPFRILILGDFSGRVADSRGKPEGRKLHQVDRDNFDEVMARLGVELALADISPAPLRFAELDDFHPDRLFERASFFQKLRELRGRLADRSTYVEAARELGVDPTSKPVARETPPAAALDAVHMAQTAGANLLEDAIGATEVRSGGGEAPARRTDDLAAFVRRAVEPHLVSKADPKQAELVSVIDQAAAAQMRALLHLPKFQALEAAWRAVDFLVRRVETGVSLKIFLWNISKEELENDLASKQDLSGTQTYKVLVPATTFGGEPWALLVGNYAFGRGSVDLLTRLAELARAAGAPLIAGGGLDLLGCKTAGELNDWRTWQDWSAAPEAGRWNALRRGNSAGYLGLALPRFLLRLPYGKETDAVSQFNFEEMSGSPEHDEYLWGNSAFLCACLLARAFAEDQWSMRPEEELEVNGLPLHVYNDQGESVAKPCAETLLTEQSALRILDTGIMPLASLKDSDAVRLVRLQSIAQPVKALAGRWV